MRVADLVWRGTPNDRSAYIKYEGNKRHTIFKNMSCMAYYIDEKHDHDFDDEGNAYDRDHEGYVLSMDVVCAIEDMLELQCLLYKLESTDENQLELSLSQQEQPNG